MRLMRFVAQFPFSLFLARDPFMVWMLDMKPPFPIFAFAFLATFVVADQTGYYQRDALFSKRPKADAELSNLTRVGPIGIGLDLLQPAFTMRVKTVEAGSPAASAGIKLGMVIESINGERLAAIDPRIQLGDWITEAEAGNGELRMQVVDQPGGKSRQLVVKIPVMGRYSKTWPLDCPKSDNIVRNYAEYLKKPGANQGFAGIGMLFLLSTGEQSDLEHVRKWARAQKGSASYPWHIGYGGLALCEYYLRTGDSEVLPAIQKMVDRLVETENFGGWAGRGGTASLSYGGGGGHLNAGGTLCLGYLMLAKECGADVPEDTLIRVLKRFYRYSGRGNVPYGKGKPEGGFTDNGKNGKLAFSMAAAASLDPKGEDSIYARARDASAQFAFYSTSFMLHGHTGGGIGEIWRSASMGLVHDDLPTQYREFMDNRRWHYELSRRFDGSFAILGGERYDNTEWGAGYALTYTVPRKTLQLTGAPRSPYSKPHSLPDRPWGTAEDDDFQLIEPATNSKGDDYDLSTETFLKHTGLGILRRLAGQINEATLRTYMHHPDIVVRGTAAKSIGSHGEGVLMEFLKYEDARVRRAALQGLNGHASSLLSRAVFDHVIQMVKNPEESWFVKELALSILGKAPSDWVVEEVDLIVSFLKHEEWWLQQSALAALLPIATDKRVYGKVLPAIGQLLQSNYQFAVSGPVRWGPLAGQLKTAPENVQELARKSFKEAYLNFEEYKHPSEKVVSVVNPMNLEAIADSISKLPGGYDTLYQIGKQQNPEEDLPFRKVFLEANPKDLSPELKKLVDESVGGNLIPAYIAKHKEVLVRESRSEPVKRGAMGGLLELYNKVGVDQYNWQDHGPKPTEMSWSYHSFDPKEKFMEPDDRLGRYREVSFPPGMENWFEKSFDAKDAGWETGLAPFGAADGVKGYIAGSDRECDMSFCKCNDPIQTLWEKDVVLLQGTFDFPTFEEGCRYRLLHSGISRVGSGGGYRIYVNGKLFHEDKTGVDRRGGGRPEGKIITRDWWPEFEGGQVTLSAISFKKHHPRSKKYGGNIAFFMQRMKVPTIESNQ